MEGSGGTTERPFPLDDVLGVLGGEAEASADWAVVTVRRSHWGGRTFEVQVDGALAYLQTFLSTNPDRVKARWDAISYFDLDIQEFTGTTNPDGDPIIIDADGPRLTHDVPSPAEQFLEAMGRGGGWFACRPDPSAPRRH